MANGTVPHELSVVTTDSPTAVQLRNAKILIAWLVNRYSASRCTITDFLGTGEAMVSNQDIGGAYQTAYIQWNKSAGTLSCDANNTISWVLMIF